jgi:hypothetical protein
MSETMQDMMEAAPMEATLTFGARESERRVTGFLSALEPEGCVIQGAEVITDVKYAWLEVQLPTGETIRPLAEVAGARGEGMALSFRYVFPKDRARIHAFGAHYRTEPA